MTAPAKSTLEILGTPLAALTGVTPQIAECFQRLGLRSVLDLLFYFPRDYEDFTDLRAIKSLEHDAVVSVAGTVTDLELRRSRRPVLGVLIEDGTGALRAMWFNQPYMHLKFAMGQRVLFSGKVALKGGRWQMAHPRVQWLDNDEAAAGGKILPIYSLTEGLAQWHVRRAMVTALDLAADLLDEVFPAEFLAAHNLGPIRGAIRRIHYPGDQESLAVARRRFVFQELFILQLALAVRRQRMRVLGEAPSLEATARIDARIRRLLPFELTEGQKQAIAEISDDLKRPFPTNRLLQGDVGSGKTVVAVYAMLLTVAHGYQAALMAPTEILARQHAATFGRLLAAGRVRIGLLTGGLTTSERTELRAKIAAGEIDLVIGTHAVVQEDVEFAKLGLVVIDEQHKFGVRQRANLRKAGVDPHYLVMTATPIPRTVTMTLFGDLDVSTLRDMPPGRQKVNTYVPPPEKREAWWDFFRRKLRSGQQGYVIAPLVEEAESIESASVQSLYEALANGELEDFRIGFIHGRMSIADKQHTMEEFRRGEIQVLVSTTVIEVGVDVPNANLMTIEGGERFGLSQLHQLRGRIGRGSHPGFCAVFADPQSEESRLRLEAFARTTDGFELAELDLAIRGPGDLFGTKQHGMPPLRIADLTRDGEVLEEARRVAVELVTADAGLALPEHARLRRMMLARYGQVLDLGDVG